MKYNRPAYVVIWLVAGSTEVVVGVDVVGNVVTTVAKNVNETQLNFVIPLTVERS